MTWRARAAALLREPLIHFLIAGAAVFWVLAGRPPDLGERRIVVGQAVVAGLVQRFGDSFHRPPAPDEVDGMIRQWVQDQVYYREALRLGLDQGDEVVIKRMRRKLEVMAVAEAETSEPSDAELQVLLEADPARYAADPRTSFEQVYLGADTPQARAAAEAALKRLRAGGTAAGIAAPLPARIDDAATGEIAGGFGDEFALALREVPLGTWTGPVASGLGLHLVRVSARRAADRPSVAAARQRLTNDWRAASIAKARDAAYARILKGYDVVIEPAK